MYLIFFYEGDIQYLHKQVEVYVFKLNDSFYLLYLFT